MRILIPQQVRHKWMGVIVLFVLTDDPEIYNQINGLNANMVMFLWHLLYNYDEAFLFLFFYPLHSSHSLWVCPASRDLIATGLVYMPFVPISRNTSDQGMLWRHWCIIGISLFSVSQSFLLCLFSLIYLLCSNVKQHYFYGRCMKGELISVHFWFYSSFLHLKTIIDSLISKFLPSFYLYSPLSLFNAFLLFLILSFSLLLSFPPLSLLFPSCLPSSFLPFILCCCLFSSPGIYYPEQYCNIIAL